MIVRLCTQGLEAGLPFWGDVSRHADGTYSGFPLFIRAIAYDYLHMHETHLAIAGTNLFTLDNRNMRIDATGQAAVLRSSRYYVSPFWGQGGKLEGHASSVKTCTGVYGQLYDFVFSDELEVDNRTFCPSLDCTGLRSTSGTQGGERHGVVRPEADTTRQESWVY